jgi:hypothetical protein
MADELSLGQKVPPQSERATVGGITRRIRRGTDEFKTLVSVPGADIVFKDEEGTGADRLMSPRLRDGLVKLGKLVAAEFPGKKLRVTEAWDETGEHTEGSLHYEGRAADITVSDLDRGKLGRLGRLAVDAGLDWVFFEDRTHVHVSVRKTGPADASVAPAPVGADDGQPDTVAEAIRKAVRALSDEQARISRVGPAFTDEEHMRMMAIALALPGLEEANRALERDPAADDGPVAGEEDLDGDEEDVVATTPAAPAVAAAVTAATASNPALDAALAALRPLVRTTSHPDALPFAFRAYFNYKAAKPANVRNPFLYFVDYGLSNSTRRGYVFDMSRLTVVDGPFTVSHGSGSGPRNAVPNVFNNLKGKFATSLGLYRTREHFPFSGSAAGTGPYRSIGLILDGESGEFNSLARAREVIVHGAPYVTRDDAGRSKGCPAMELDRAKRLIPLIAEGGVVFHFSPNDAGWMKRDPWVHAG